MEQNHSEAVSFSASLEIPSILWNWKCRFRFHDSPPLVPILRHIHTVYIHPISLVIILILSLHLRLGLPSGLFRSGFPTRTPYVFLFFLTFLIPRLSHPWFDRRNKIWQGRSLLCIEFWSSFHFSGVRDEQETFSILGIIIASFSLIRGGGGGWWGRAAARRFIDLLYEFGTSAYICAWILKHDLPLQFMQNVGMVCFVPSAPIATRSCSWLRCNCSSAAHFKRASETVTWHPQRWVPTATSSAWFTFLIKQSHTGIY
jgi:hypothetical protein